MQAGRLVNINSKYQQIKYLLDSDEEICKYQIEYDGLRKAIDYFKRVHNYTIYRNDCQCGLHPRKHFSYEKDWASDYALQ